MHGILQFRPCGTCLQLQLANIQSKQSEVVSMLAMVGWRAWATVAIVLKIIASIVTDIGELWW